MTRRDNLLEDIGKDIHRMEQHERAPATWVGIAVTGGTVGLLFVVPIVAGAYLGRWLDTLAEGYSVRWTVSGILLGIATGGYNAFRFLRSRT
jgi:ATP synthase protein I